MIATLVLAATFFECFYVCLRITLFVLFMQTGMELQATHLSYSTVYPFTLGGQDYIPISESITLRTDELSYCFQLATLDDDILEDERETLSLLISLSPHEERVHLQQESVDVTIIDNDGTKHSVPVSL